MPYQERRKTGFQCKFSSFRRGSTEDPEDHIFMATMTTLLNFMGKNKYTFDGIIISYSKISPLYWILKDDNFQNVFKETLISPKASDGCLSDRGNFVLTTGIT